MAPEEKTSRPDTKIIIGLDTSFSTQDALRLASRLAASVDARLQGVFIEDENLLTLAALPFAREISFSGEVRHLDAARMLNAMKAQAETARRMLARMAEEAHVEWRFDVRRGHPLASLAENAAVADTLLIRSPDAAPRDVARAVRAATQDAHADVLLVSGRVGVSGVFPRRTVSGSTLTYARPYTRHASEPSSIPIRSLVVIDDGSSVGENCSAFASSLARRIGMPFHHLPTPIRDIDDIVSRARRHGAGLLVVHASWLGNDDEAARISALAGCPVLILGSERGVRDDTTNT